MHAGHQYIFVVGAIENAKLTLFWQGDRMTPQVIVLQLFGSRCLKTMDNNASGIEFLEYLPDKRILPGGVHTLNTDQYSISVVRIDDLLNLCDFFSDLFQSLDRLFLRYFRTDIGRMIL